MPQAAGQVKFLIFLVKINVFPIYANSCFDAGQVLIFKILRACYNERSVVTTLGPSFLNGSSSFLQVTRTTIKA